jgi:hypothetical protein
MTDHPPVACCPSRSHTGHHVSQGTRFRAKKKWVITSLLAAYCVVSFKCPYLRRKAVCIQLGHDCRVDVVGLDQCFGNQPDLERVGNNDLTGVVLLFISSRTRLSGLSWIANLSGSSRRNPARPPARSTLCSRYAIATTDRDTSKPIMRRFFHRIRIASGSDTTTTTDSRLQRNRPADAVPNPNPLAQNSRQPQEIRQYCEPGRNRESRRQTFQARSSNAATLDIASNLPEVVRRFEASTSPPTDVHKSFWRPIVPRVVRPPRCIYHDAAGAISGLCCATKFS